MFHLGVHYLFGIDFFLGLKKTFPQVSDGVRSLHCSYG
jgi:hypothetical protein